MALVIIRTFNFMRNAYILNGFVINLCINYLYQDIIDSDDLLDENDRKKPDPSTLKSEDAKQFYSENIHYSRY